MRFARWVAAIFLLPGGAGCGEDGGGEGAGGSGFRLPPVYERVCDAAEDCPGRKCVRVGLNAQEVTGVCSRPCGADADCGGNAACFLLGDAGPSCLALCSDADPCEGGLACVVVGAAGERACFVSPPP